MLVRPSFKKEVNMTLESPFKNGIHSILVHQSFKKGVNIAIQLSFKKEHHGI